MYKQVVESIIDQIKKYPEIVIYEIQSDVPKSNLITNNIVEFRNSINQNGLNLILDIDGTLLDSSLDQYLILRPHCTDLFELCQHLHINVYLWTCGQDEHAYRVIDAINGEKYLRKVLCRGDSWYYNASTIKKLKWLSKSMDNLLLVDNTINMSEGQIYNTIIIKNFEPINCWSGKCNYNSLSDDKLLKLTEFLDNFVRSGQKIPDFIKSHLKPDFNMSLKYYSI